VFVIDSTFAPVIIALSAVHSLITAMSGPLPPHGTLQTSVPSLFLSRSRGSLRAESKTAAECLLLHGPNRISIRLPANDARGSELPAHIVATASLSPPVAALVSTLDNRRFLSCALNSQPAVKLPGREAMSPSPIQSNSRFCVSPAERVEKELRSCLYLTAARSPEPHPIILPHASVACDRLVASRGEAYQTQFRRASKPYPSTRPLGPLSVYITPMSRDTLKPAPLDPLDLWNDDAWCFRPSTAVAHPINTLYARSEQSQGGAAEPPPPPPPGDDATDCPEIRKPALDQV